MKIKLQIEIPRICERCQNKAEFFTLRSAFAYGYVIEFLCKDCRLPAKPVEKEPKQKQDVQPEIIKIEGKNREGKSKLLVDMAEKMAIIDIIKRKPKAPTADVPFKKVSSPHS